MRSRAHDSRRCATRASSRAPPRTTSQSFPWPPCDRLTPAPRTCSPPSSAAAETDDSDPDPRASDFPSCPCTLPEPPSGLCDCSLPLSAAFGLLQTRMSHHRCPQAHTPRPGINIHPSHRPLLPSRSVPCAPHIGLSAPIHSSPQSDPSARYRTHT